MNQIRKNTKDRKISFKQRLKKRERERNRNDEKVNEKEKRIVKKQKKGEYGISFFNFVFFFFLKKKI